MSATKEHYHEQIEAGQRNEGKELPILFSTPMVQSNLEGRKTNTRRTTGLDVINKDPNRFEFVRIQYYNDCCKAVFRNNNTGNTHLIKCRYGQPDDLLWIRETWCHPNLFDGFEKDYYFKAGFSVSDIKDRNASQLWRPSIHMPKAAARIWLEVEEIRVERLQDISEEDAKAEGVSALINTYPGIDNYKDIKIPNYRTGFMKIWIKINGEESWKDNPWVWVVKFKVLSTTGKPETT